MRTTWTHQVTKWSRGDKGEWFAFRGTRFASLTAALDYADSFAAEQREVAGSKILVTARGRKLVVRRYERGVVTLDTQASS